jgi:sensor c-di-GMP phosphodiesterase-like protein
MPNTIPSIWSNTLPRWVVRVLTLSYWHVVLVVGMAVATGVVSWLALEPLAQRTEETESHRLALSVANASEKTLHDITTTLRALDAKAPPDWCAPDALAGLVQLAFDRDDIREMGGFDDKNRLVCTTSQGLLQEQLRLSFTPSATYDDLIVHSVVRPYVSPERSTYAVRVGRVNALTDGNRWLMHIDPRDFKVQIRDRKSGQEIVANNQRKAPGVQTTVESEHFTVTIVGTGLFAARWLSSVKHWALVAMGVSGTLIIAVVLLLVARLRGPLQKIRRVIRLFPENVQLAYQPIIGVQQAQIVGVESLLRMKDEHGTLLPPDVVFAALDSHSRLTQQLTLQIIRTAFTELAPWLHEDRARFIAVNLTDADLGNSKLPRHLSLLLQKHHIRPAQLHLEVLETTHLADKRTPRILQAFRDLGCQLWLDDFGVGYSNMARLHTLPINGVKLDRDWVTSLDDTQHGRTDGISHLVMFASSHGWNVVAEGVSDEPAMRTLLRLGIQKMQGFLFSPALPMEEFLKLSSATVTEAAPRSLHTALTQLRA